MKRWILPLFLISFSFIFSEETLSQEEPFVQKEPLSQEKGREEEMSQLNQELYSARKRLKQSYEKIKHLQTEQSSVEEFEKALVEVQSSRKKIKELQERWREQFLPEEEEGYGFWNQGETTLGQLVMEYGSNDFVYIIPQELGGTKVQLFSLLPIPRESWSEMVEIILSQNGIGVKSINAYAKQLYLLKSDLSAIEVIAHAEKDLQGLEPQTRVCYVLSPQGEQVRGVQAFLERFSSTKQTSVQCFGSKIAIVSSKENVDKLLGLYKAVWGQNNGKVVKVLHAKKMSVVEAEKFIKVFFSNPTNKNRSSFYQQYCEELTTIALPQGLVVMGSLQAVEQAEQILEELESQLDDPGEMVTYWYTCRHSDPQELADVLEKVYQSLTANGPLSKPGEGEGKLDRDETLPVMPGKVEPGHIEVKPTKRGGNFIADPKTASLLVVVHREELEKIKALLKKMDVPKKMVQIDVLLVEKREIDRKQIGINLLKLGSLATKDKKLGLEFDHHKSKGILDFIFHRKSSPSFNLAYNFLLAQENVRIDANPSVIAVNQTPAVIAIMEEISINTGAVPLDTSGGGVVFEKSFTRAQFGIKLVMTPTIHLPASSDPEQKGYVTLQTDITFDTTHSSKQDRPDVTRRHIENEVRVADGETIILGGLRKMITEGSNEKIPFLGEIPGLGKLFGSKKTTKSDTEMFIFITPRIIVDPYEDMDRAKKQSLTRRAGDTVELIERLREAKDNEKKQYFEQSMQLVWDQL